MVVVVVLMVVVVVMAVYDCTPSCRNYLMNPASKFIASVVPCRLDFTMNNMTNTNDKCKQWR